ncbi:hypothetical protein ACQWKR_24620, partial [Salmonella enterica subsp. enterica serovar Infantis]
GGALVKSKARARSRKSIIKPKTSEDYTKVGLGSVGGLLVFLKQNQIKIKKTVISTSINN